MKGLRQSDTFKCMFHQETKALWEKNKFSKTNLVLSHWKKVLSTIMCVPDFVASNYEKVTSILQIYDFVPLSFYIGLPLF